MKLRVSQHLLLILVLGGYSASSYASCSDSKIRSLANQGHTNTAIAEKCNQSKFYINSVLEEEEEDGSLLPSGTAVSYCGCWGSAFPGAQISDNRCESGVAIAHACNAMCQNGSLMWQTHCQ